MLGQLFILCSVLSRKYLWLLFCHPSIIFVCESYLAFEDKQMFDYCLLNFPWVMYMLCTVGRFYQTLFDIDHLFQDSVVLLSAKPMGFIFHLFQFILKFLKIFGVVVFWRIKVDTINVIFVLPSFRLKYHNNLSSLRKKTSQ